MDSIASFKGGLLLPPPLGEEGTSVFIDFSSSVVVLGWPEGNTVVVDCSTHKSIFSLSSKDVELAEKGGGGGEDIVVNDGDEASLY